MPSNKLSGNLLGLKIGGNFVACEISCEINFDSEMRAASSIASGRWKEFIPGVRSWNVTLNAAMLIRAVGSGLPEVLNLFISGGIATLDFTVKNPIYPEFKMSGSAYVQSGSISGAANTAANWNTTFMGTGPFTVVSDTPETYDTIFFGTMASRPTTEAQIENLFATEYGVGPFILETGATNRFRVIAVPEDKKIDSVYNISAEEDVTSEYIYTIMNIDGLPFKIYVMETVLPYSSNNLHEFVLEND